MNATPITRNTIKAVHNPTINGAKFQIRGAHEYMFKQNSVMKFSIHLMLDNGNSMGRDYIRISDIRKIAAELIERRTISEKRAIYNSRFKGMTLEQIMSHPDFRYGRFVIKNDGSGSVDYVNIYCANAYSPTGVTLEAGCTEVEFDRVAALTNNSHNYLVASEGRRIVAA